MEDSVQNLLQTLRVSGHAFRTHNALATCQALVNNVIRAHLDLTAIAYLDDILVYLNTQREHTTHVKDVLRCL